MAVSGVIGDVLAAKRSGAPLVSVQTVDPYGLLRALVADVGEKRPIVCWDCVTGPRGANDRGTAECGRLIPAPEVEGQAVAVKFSEAIGLLSGLAEGSILCVMGADLVLAGPDVPGVQAIINARDLWESNGIMILLLVGLGAALPVQIAGDVLGFVDPLPDADARRAIVSECVRDARAVKSDIAVGDDAIEGAVDALAGLTAFNVRQTSSLSFVKRATLDPAYLWDRKRAAIDSVKGLSMDPAEGPTLADVGGLGYIREFAGKLASARDPFSLVVRIEEIEKAIGAALTETSGTGRDQLFTLLDRMESYEWIGLTAVGPPGSGKSYFAEVLARTFGRRSVKLDLGRLKGSLVGESEANVRAAIETIYAMGGKRCYFVATSNGLDSVPAELRRRFCDGIYFFDLPSRADRLDVWRVHLRRYGLADRWAEVEAVEARGVEYSAAEVRNIVRRAFQFRESLMESAARVVPYCVSDAAGLLRLRQSAAGSWVCASNGGAYVMRGSGGAVPSVAGRRLDLGGA